MPNWTRGNESKTAPTVTVVHDWARGGSLSRTVIESIATAKGVSPLDLQPLIGAVDPDALDKLFLGMDGLPRSEGSLRFAFAGCEILVQSDGTISVWWEDPY